MGRQSYSLTIVESGRNAFLWGLAITQLLAPRGEEAPADCMHLMPGHCG